MYCASLAGRRFRISFMQGQLPKTEYIYDWVSVGVIFIPSGNYVHCHNISERLWNVMKKTFIYAKVMK